MQLNKKLLVERFEFPVLGQPPANPVYMLVHSVTTSNYTGTTNTPTWGTGAGMANLTRGQATIERGTQG